MYYTSLAVIPPMIPYDGSVSSIIDNSLGRGLAILKESALKEASCLYWYFPFEIVGD